MNDTPTTDAKWETLCCSGQSWYQIAEEMKLDCRQRERELDEAREYADKLAEGLPEGMLPKDVEVLREANLGLATNIAAVTEQRDRLADQIESNHKCTLMLERMVYQLREQNDRLAEAIRKHRDELELTSGESVNRMLWNTLAAVKENQKTDSQSCPECDALASYGSNDGPCETHKL